MKKTKIYSVKCFKKDTKGNRLCFVHFGKKRKKDNIVGEIITRTEPNSIGNIEDLVLIKFTASGSHPQENIINEIIKGEPNIKLRKEGEKKMLEGFLQNTRYH